MTQQLAQWVVFVSWFTVLLFWFWEAGECAGKKDMPSLAWCCFAIAGGCFSGLLLRAAGAFSMIF